MISEYSELSLKCCDRGILGIYVPIPKVESRVVLKKGIMEGYISLRIKHHLMSDTLLLYEKKVYKNSKVGNR